MVAYPKLGTLPSLSAPESILVASPDISLQKGMRLDPVFCVREIERQYKIVQRKMNDLVQAFYKEFPTQLGRKGYTISPLKYSVPNGGSEIRKLYWRKYNLRAFEKSANASRPESPQTLQEILRIKGKRKAAFEYGKKRYTKLPKAFWDRRNLKENTRQRFSYYDQELMLLNKQIDFLAEKLRRIRAMYQSLRRTSLFKQEIVLGRGQNENS